MRKMGNPSLAVNGVQKCLHREVRHMTRVDIGIGKSYINCQSRAAESQGLKFHNITAITMFNLDDVI